MATILNDEIILGETQGQEANKDDHQWLAMKPCTEIRHRGGKESRKTHGGRYTAGFNLLHVNPVKPCYT